MKIENTKKEVKSYKGILTKYQSLPEKILLNNLSS